jgi:hypothetical protein
MNSSLRLAKGEVCDESMLFFFLFDGRGGMVQATLGKEIFKNNS